MSPRVLGLVALLIPLAACSGEVSADWEHTSGPRPQARPSPEAPDILVVMVDTLRPDHLSCYGYDRPTSPFLDAWAEGAALYEQAYTHGTHTRIATASLFTGTLPTVHRIENVELKPGPDGTGVTDILSDSLTTWAESLTAAGYETWGFSSNPHIAEEFGFAQGFQDFWETSDRRAPRLIDAFLERLERRDPERPLFAYLHLMDPHNPYNPPVAYRYLYDVPKGKRRYRNGPIDVSPRDLAWSRAQYDGEIRHLDDQLARLFGVWEGRADRPRASVVLSDHGEEFLEHGGMGHGTTVHEELARTALLVKGPGVTPGRFPSPVAQIDVHNLVLELAGCPAPAEAQGRPYGRWETDPAELLTTSRSGDWAWRRGPWTLIEAAGGGEAWFDRSTDPGELTPLGPPPPAGDLRAELERLRARDAATAERLGTPARRSLAADTIEALRGIGYLGGEEE